MRGENDTGPEPLELSGRQGSGSMGRPGSSLSSPAAAAASASAAAPAAAAAAAAPAGDEDDAQAAVNEEWCGEGPKGAEKEEMTWAISLLTCVAAIGGFLFGYDTGVVSGAMLKVKDELGLDRWQEEMVVSSTVGAAIVGSLLGGRFSESFGRKPIIVLSALTFTVGALEMALAGDYRALTVGRSVIGFGIGMSSLLTPVYIAECAPAHLRGKLVSINVFLITLGQFVAGMVDGFFSEVDGGWRWMLGLSGLPSLLMLLGMLPLPESPRWLARKGEHSKTRGVLQMLRGHHTDISHELNEIVDCVEREKEETASLWYMLTTPHVRRALFIGCTLQFIQQFVGINTVMYYSASIYSMAGFADNAAIWLAGFTALSQGMGVLVSVHLIESYGRRPLLLSSLGAVVVCLLLLGSAFYLSLSRSPKSSGGDDLCLDIDNVFFGPVTTSSCYQCTMIDSCGFCASSDGSAGMCYVSADSAGDGGTDAKGRCSQEAWMTNTCEGSAGALAGLSMVLYLFSFGIGMSGVPWAMNAEMHQNNVRSMATSITTACNWIGNFFVAATFLSISSPEVLTAYGAFWMYGTIAGISWLWIYFFVPETKGVHMEDMAMLFSRASDRPRGNYNAGFSALGSVEYDDSYWAQDGHDYAVIQQAPASRGWSNFNLGGGARPSRQHYASI